MPKKSIRKRVLKEKGKKNISKKRKTNEAEIEIAEVNPVASTSGVASSLSNEFIGKSAPKMKTRSISKGTWYMSKHIYILFCNIARFLLNKSCSSYPILS
jgi:hypothetical protein